MSEADALLPQSLADERGRAFVALLLERFAGLDLSALLVNRVDSAPAAALPALGWQFGLIGAEGWHLADDQAQHRELIRRAVLLHRRRGTPWAVKEALRAVGFPSAVIEEGRPRLLLDGEISADGGTTLDGDTRWALFRVMVDLGDDRGLSVADRAMVRLAIETWKNARSRLDGVSFRATHTERVLVGESLAARGKIAPADQVPWGKGTVTLMDGRLRMDQGTPVRLDGALTADGAARCTGYRGHPGSMGAERAVLTAKARVVTRDRVSATIDMDGLFACNGVLRFGDNPGCYEVLGLRAVRRWRLNGGWSCSGAEVGGPKLNGQYPCNGTLLFKERLRLEGMRVTHLTVN